ncbi:hypothetical protein [Candidatus Poriferisocius sp.]|uniref:hypothetical protein n=1 Tax=Candidatus Poriferisocius sp. TaxID=3101276 RepID=UPI003B01C9A6
MAYRTSYEGLGIEAPDLTTTLTDPVSFDVYIRPDQIGPRKEWPPARFRARNKRLDYLAGLWRGSLGAAIDLGANPVVVNEFKAYSVKLANLLLMSEPTAPGVSVTAETIEELEPNTRVMGDENGLIQVCFDALIDLTRYGGCLLLRLGGGLSVVEPRNWYPTREMGHLFVSPWLSDEAPDIRPDRLDVVWVAESGVTRDTYAFDGETQIGEHLDGELLGDGRVEVVARDPRQGIWGSAKYLEIWAPVAEIARRYSTNSRVLDLFTAPSPVFRQGDLDARARFNVTADDTQIQANQKILEGQLGIITGDTIHLPDDLLDIEYLQPQTEGVAHALAQVEAMNMALRDIAGLPNLQGQTLSGEALKRLYIHFYAETSQIQTTLRLALETLLEAAIDWPHIFDSGLFDAEPVEGRGGPNAVSDPVAEPDTDPEV